MRAKILSVIFTLCFAVTLQAQERTISSIDPPEGFIRLYDTMHDITGFGEYLRSLPLKPEGSKVHLYDGSEKYWQGGAYAVIDMKIGHSDLQQCADAVIRLRAEYLWREKRYSAIHFNFTNGFRADYSKWADGYRIKVSGNKAEWYKATSIDYSYKTFRKYLDVVFSYAGTASLSKELEPVDIQGIQIGDVFIRGGHPGHAMIVVDMIEAPNSRKAILVAQSYMPAQEIHIVTNLNSPKTSPWYIIDSNTSALHFPEWTFSSIELKRFKKEEETTVNVNEPHDEWHSDMWHSVPLLDFIMNAGMFPEGFYWVDIHGHTWYIKENPDWGSETAANNGLCLFEYLPAGAPKELEKKNLIQLPAKGAAPYIYHRIDESTLSHPPVFRQNDKHD